MEPAKDRRLGLKLRPNEHSHVRWPLSLGQTLNRSHVTLATILDEVVPLLLVFSILGSGNLRCRPEGQSSNPIMIL
jgi:hypothetical protein